METNLIPLETIKLYLPKYLTPESSKQLFEGLKQFPANYEKNFYSDVTKQKPSLLQGDALTNLPYFDYRTKESKDVDALVISNSCDISPENNRLFSSHLVFTPLIRVQKYITTLVNHGISQSSIDEHLKAIIKQRVTQIFYLPKGSGLEEDCLIFFDRVQNIRLDDMPTDALPDRKIFSLSNCGFYMFIVKLSMHFTRIMEDVDRVA